MYTINNSKKEKITLKEELINIDGFLMASKRKVFKINGAEIREIKVVNKKFANPLVYKKVLQKYNTLISLLTDLLVSDDDSGDSCREALNQIEKFRMEIKNKYRRYLKKNELEKMSKQLMTLKKEATKKIIELQNSYLEYQNQSNRRR